MDQNIKTSEKKLTRSFVFGAMIFLIFFEGIFLFSRYIAENNRHKDAFIRETNQFFHKKNIEENTPFFIGIDAVKTDKNGNILMSQFKNSTAKNIDEIINSDTLQKLGTSIGNIIQDGDYIIRKIENNNSITYFFWREKNNFSSLQRDMLRFLLLNILILIPLWFLIRLHIQKILRPVQENMDTMTHFVQDAGHELKTPLAIISGNLQIMRDSKKMETDLIEWSLETIDAMNASIGGLLELANIKTPDQSQKTNISEIILQEIKNANNFKNINFTTHIPEKKFLDASEKHLSILMRNLIENAIKYNKNNGNVEISLTKNIFTIKDTGIGMTEDDIKRIFDRFYRANQGSKISGSGIGMTLVEKIIKLYQWKIEVKSQLWSGTEIIIYF